MLLGFIGYLFFENSKLTMKNTMRLEMTNQIHMLFMTIALESKKSMYSQVEIQEKKVFLSTLNHSKFKVGYYSKDKKPIYSEMGKIVKFDEGFFVDDVESCMVAKNLNDYLNIRYIILKECGLATSLHYLLIEIVGYLLLACILMGAGGYLLGIFLLYPVRAKIESLDRFISNTTHELNTPISAILMTIQSLKDVEPKKMKRLEVVSKRLSMIYSSLTYKMEGKTEVNEKFCLAKIVKERIEFIEELIEAKRLVIQLELDPTQILMSKRSVCRLIDNLISNAIKYSYVGGVIKITLANNVLRVKDTGIGIDEKKQTDIFKRYYRANNEYKGFGIGLDIVFTVCEQYKIKLGLESKKEEGSTFVLTFPTLK